MNLFKEFIAPASIAFVSFIFSVIILGLVSQYIFLNPRVIEYGIFEALSIWDAPHYLDVATNWYQPTGDDAYWIVFLPLYPSLVAFVNLFTFSGILYSSFIVSGICAIICAIFFYKLLLFDEKKKTALLSVSALFFFPTAFFLFLPYPESVFLMLVLATFYFCRKENFILASAFAAFATATKIAGLALVPVIFIELILHHAKFNKPASLFRSFLVLNLPILGFLVYLLINYQVFGDIFYFQKAQSQNWNTDFSLFVSSIKQSWSFTRDADFDTRIYLGYGQLLAFGLAVLTTIYSFFRLRKSYFVYSLALLFIYGSMSYWLSFPRYLLSLFPLFIMLGRLANNRMFLILWAFVSLIFLFVFGTIAFEHGPVL